MAFQKAVKARSLLRLALFGPAGSGKTYSSLAIASGMAGAIGSRVAVIDTERGSASKYADRFDFDVCELERPVIDAYVEALRDAARGSYKVVVIDSLTHGWQELLDEVDKIAARMGGNTWAAWGKATPQQRRLIDAILRYPGHILATMRSKTAWETGEDKRGKKAPVRIGLAPEQRGGVEYEFDLLGSIDVDHVLKVEKDRTGKYQDQYLERPGEDFGRELVAWLDDGAAPPRESRTPAPEASPRSQPSTKRPVDGNARPVNPDFDSFAAATLAGFDQSCRDLCIPAPDIHPLRMLNAIVSRAIDAGLVRPEAVLKPARSGEEPKRSGARSRDAFAWLAKNHPGLVNEIVDGYLAEKAEEAREAEAIRTTEGGNDL